MAAEAEAAAKKLIDETKIPVVVVKAQIHAGGRGKGGGVKLAKKGPAEARELADKMLGKAARHAPDRSRGAGRPPPLYRAGARHRARALRCARARPRLAPRGGHGVDRRRHGHRAGRPRDAREDLHACYVDPVVGLAAYQARQVGFSLGLEKDQIGKFTKLMLSFYDLFIKEDCSLCEVNPLVVTKQGEVVALDGKINFDDNAEFRHREWNELRDRDEEDPVELEAKEAGLSYVSLDGDIGCLVNGAGLAMSTMDIIQTYGGSPANFLDVGGGATQEQVAKAFGMIMRSPKVKGIFVNIFGGIMKCDVIAAGVIAATKQMGLKVPLVVRLEGTNVDEGRKMLEQSGLAIQAASTMADGAKKIVAAIGARG